VAIFRQCSSSIITVLRTPRSVASGQSIAVIRHAAVLAIASTLVLGVPFGAADSVIHMTLMALKVTLHEEAGITTVKLEGRLARPWLNELDRTWQSLSPSLGSKKLVIDVCGLTYMDGDAKLLLAEMFKKTGARFLADTPMTKYFAEEAQR